MVRNRPKLRYNKCDNLGGFYTGVTSYLLFRRIVSCTST